LHISKEEQAERLRARIEDPERHWKVSEADFRERQFWDDYTEAHEVVLSKCSTEWAPWYVIPANRKWFRNLAVAGIVVEELESMDLQFSKSTMDISTIVFE